jgi:hypothetical protein
VAGTVGVSSARRGTGSRWAPWWAYVVPILALNYLRQVVISPDDVGDAANVAMFVALTLVVAAVVTLVHLRRLKAPRSSR